MSKINSQWVAYNNIYNEGGEGYNPHPQYIEGKGEPEWSILDSKAAKIRRIMNCTSDSDPRFAELQAEYDVTIAAYKIAMAGL